MAREYLRDVRVVGEMPISEDIIIYNDFSLAVPWAKTSGSAYTDSEVEIAREYAGSGRYGARLTAQNVENRACEIYIWGAPGRSAIAEMITRVSAPLMSASYLKYITFKIWVSNRFLSKSYHLRYDVGGGKWQYLNTAGGYTDISGGAQALSDGAWHTVTLKFDMVNGTYVRARCDLLDMDLTGIEAYTRGTSTASELAARIEIVAGESGTGWLDVDYLLVRSE